MATTLASYVGAAAGFLGVPLGVYLHGKLPPLAFRALGVVTIYAATAGAYFAGWLAVPPGMTSPMGMMTLAGVAAGLLPLPLLLVAKGAARPLVGAVQCAAILGVGLLMQANPALL